MLYILVEGHGEVKSVSNLVNRLWNDLGLKHIPIYPPIRWPKVHSEEGIKKGIELVLSRGNATGLLIIRDDEDNCPKEFAPYKAEFIRTLNIPFPVSYHLMYREYEVLFLPCLHIMAGKLLVDERGIEREGIINGARFEGDFEQNRDVKGIISSFFPQNRKYKPTLDQLPLTRMIDFELLRESEVPCFGTLERCLKHIEQNLGSSSVYPSPVLNDGK
jgi:Domain of unknown function (DUF4276)